MYRKTRIAARLFTCTLALAFASVSALGQVRPVYDQGALGLAQLIKRLDTSASVMMIGAHPDDEDTALLAYLARGENARTAYLSVTRGDGGQNLIGPELGEALGVIRTEELLQARRLDGAEQFFTRAYDYGFSKTLDEAKSKWDEKTMVCDAVRAIRSFRPLVVVSQFTGTPADGHGQHQFSGYIAPLAVRAAGDIGQCIDAGAPWTVKKFYVRHRGTGDPTLRINTGKYDPLLGRSYFEIAMEARSLHRSQDQGVLELRGDQFSAIDITVGEKDERSIFEGLDTTISGIAANTHNGEGPFRDKLERLRSIVQQIGITYDPRVPSKIVPLLMDGYKAAFDAEWSTRNASSKEFLREKERLFVQAIQNAAGVRIDALADRETVVPGEKLSVSVKTFAASDADLKVADVSIDAPTGWTTAPTDAPKEQTGFRREVAGDSRYFSIQAPLDAEITAPYWLKLPGEKDVFQWPAGDFGGLPFQAPVATAKVKLALGPREVTVSRPVEFRYADDVRGEIRREINVVPRVSLNIEKGLIVLSTAVPEVEKVIDIATVNNSTVSGAAGSVSLSVPHGWRTLPRSVPFDLPPGKRVTATFRLQPPASVPDGDYQVNAVANAADQRFAAVMHVLSYPHIQTHRFYTAASVRVMAANVKTASVNVGYIQGSGDTVAEAIMQLGPKVTLLDAKELSAGDLSRFDVVVVGVRAAQVRQDFLENHGRLLDYVRGGGTMIVQYQSPNYQSLLPFPARIGPRVADETAPVAILAPENPVFNFPNEIGPSDFAGWVQERNLNDLSDMPTEYTPLLESHDPGEPENRGGLVVAKIGKGNYVYCGYALFRQLPAGVPGAYRLLANMLSLPKANKRP